MAQASAGMRWSPLVVEQMMRSSWSGVTPAASRAPRLASHARSSSDSEVQMRRLVNQCINPRTGALEQASSKVFLAEVGTLTLEMK